MMPTLPPKDISSVCFACKAAFNGTAKPQSCHYCGHIFHAKCTKAVRDEAKNIVKACLACIAEANMPTSRSRSASVSSASSAPSNTSSRGPTPAPSSGTTSLIFNNQPPSDLLAIMEKLNKLDSLDAMHASIAQINVKVSTAVDSLITLQNEVKEVRQLSVSLNERLETAESRID